jgi:hypothetical protein
MDVSRLRAVLVVKDFLSRIGYEIGDRRETTRYECEACNSEIEIKVFVAGMDPGEAELLFCIEDLLKALEATQPIHQVVEIEV